jgi:hypothetical protein
MEGRGDRVTPDARVKILIDMNLSPAWAETLKSAGFEADHWSTLGDIRAADSTILSWARSNGYVLLTHDLDFGAILAAARSAGLPPPPSAPYQPQAPALRSPQAQPIKGVYTRIPTLAVDVFMPKTNVDQGAWTSPFEAEGSVVTGLGKGRSGEAFGRRWQ